MIKNKKRLTPSKLLSLMVLSALFATNVGAVTTVLAQAAPTVQVSITKYIGDVVATSESANSADFQMTSTWNAENIGAGTGQYTLSSTSYEASTSEMTSGASYSTNEEFDDVVGATCEEGKPFALVGYTSGETLSEAENATPSLTPPSFTNITSDKFVIVWNEDCNAVVTPPAESVEVQITKFVDGEQATAVNADNTNFLMNATWQSVNYGSGTGQYSLDETDSPVAYQTETIEFEPGASYATSEVVDGTIVSASCTGTEGSMYELVGYTSGETFSEAQNATPTLTSPSFTNMTSNKFVIVWNEDCTPNDSETPPGEIEGDVEGGIDQNGELEVTSIETIDGTATADGSFANGWEYLFHITVPTDEPEIAMKFSNWVNNANASTIPAANNMRISSQQADNGDATVLITAADTYSIPTLNMVTDLDPTMPGLQIQVQVEVAVPTNTVNGSYSTNYGVRATN